MLRWTRFQKDIGPMSYIRHRANGMRLHWANVFPMYCGMAGCSVFLNGSNVWQKRSSVCRPTALKHSLSKYQLAHRLLRAHVYTRHRVCVWQQCRLPHRPTPPRPGCVYPHVCALRQRIGWCSSSVRQRTSRNYASVKL